MENDINLPAQVYVGGLLYDVQEREDREFSDEYFGRISFPDQIIWIAKGSTPGRKVETLLHEVIHAIDDAGKLDLDERQVSVLTRGLYAMFVENPDVLDAVLHVAMTTA